MDDRIRISDADRDRATARLRDHFAEGRLTADELDERITAALSAKTHGDLRRVMTDLPEPDSAQSRAQQLPPQAPRPWRLRGHGLRILPIAALALLAVALLSHGGWVFFGIFRLFLVFWLVATLAGVIGAGRFRRRMRGGGWGGHHRGPGGYGHDAGHHSP